MNSQQHTLSVPGGEVGLLERDEGEGSGPVLLFCHGTGFCKEVWIPVIDDLADRISGWTAIAIDQRLHGHSRGFPPDFDWWHLGADVLAVLDVVAGGRPVIGIGHSSGGAAIVMAEVLRPHSLAGALLVEPIIFPPPFRASSNRRLAEAASRRRRRFASAEEAYTSYHGRGPFTLWEDRALAAYVEGGFGVDDEGSVELRCSPESEAQFFAAGSAHNLWEHLGEVGVPVSIVAGAGSNTHTAAFLASQAAQIPGANTVVVPNTTHFVPMEAPTVLADRIARVVAALPT